MYKIITRPLDLDLEQSHREYRVLFVGQHWFDRVNRPISRKKIKRHSKWTFVLTFSDPMAIAEIPLLSGWYGRREVALLPAPSPVVPPKSVSSLGDH